MTNIIKTILIYLTVTLMIMLILLNTNFLFAQVESEAEQVTDTLVLKKIDDWKNLKFGILVQWGPYSQWEIVESWTLCSEDESWCLRKSDNYTDYKRDYENLKTTFNPIKFNPQQWALMAKDAGMKYIIFTMKHHDGFCMYDTKLTNYKVTDVNCPFHTNTNADIGNTVFKAFRDQGFEIGAYFSKPDWHSPYYWWPYFATPDRHVNYDPEKYPDRWQKFKDYTYGQIKEIVSNYGKVDILWLDGGWIRPLAEPTKAIPYVQDIDMPNIATMARSYQPGLIIVDRSVKGKYENYSTPEQTVPGKLLNYPWETCMSMGEFWTYHHDDTFKSTRTLLNILINIVANGGNFLLGVGPSGEGLFHPVVIERLKEMGEWLRINGEAIYNTRPIAPYTEGKICLTSLKDGTAFAIYVAEEGENLPPKEVAVETISPAVNAKVYMLGYSNPLRWVKNGTGILIDVPETMIKNPPCQYAWTFKITSIKK